MWIGLKKQTRAFVIIGWARSLAGYAGKTFVIWKECKLDTDGYPYLNKWEEKGGF